MKESILREKSYQFALRIIKLYKFISIEKKEFVLSKQILRSGTSIGANIEEANQAQSKTDFIHKLAIAQKEAAETNYWLRLLRDSEFLTDKQAESLLVDCDELQKMLASSIKTSKENLQK
jgi:four helix bundle protein